MPVQLPREILKWLQGLDLSYSIKNVRRDFSNGFLVAEIFSRFYGNGDIQMHSYTNGESLECREDNWAQLQRFFVSRDMSETLPGELIKRVISRDPKAGVELIILVYQLLTRKELPVPDSSLDPASASDGDIPPYAQPTAVNLVQLSLRHAGVSERDDRDTTQSKVREVLDQHDENIRLDRLNKPQRFSPSHRRRQQTGAGAAGGFRVPLRTVGDGGGGGGGFETGAHAANGVDYGVVKEVHVKGVENLTARNTHFEHCMGTGPPHPTNEAGAVRDGVSSRGAHAHPAAGISAAAAGGVGAPYPGGSTNGSFSTVLNPLIVGVFDGSELLTRFDPRCDAWVSLVNVLPELPDEMAARVFDVLLAQPATAAQCAVRCLAHPREFWRFASFGLRILDTLDAESEAFAAARTFMNNVIDSMIDQSVGVGGPRVVSAMFEEFVLPLAAKLIDRSPAKRAASVELWLAASASDDSGDAVDCRLAALKCLQEALDKSSTFLLCLLDARKLDTQLSPSLVNVYLHYATIGLRSTSPTIRAASLQLIRSLVAHVFGGFAEQQQQQPPVHAEVVDEQRRAVLSLIGQLTALVADDWWEVQVQLVALCAEFLRFTPCDHPSVSEMYTIVDGCLARGRSSRAITLGVSAVSSVTRSHPCVVTPLLRCLLQVDDVLRREALFPGVSPRTVELKNSSSVSDSHVVVRLSEKWHATAALSELVSVCNDFEILDSAHIDVLLACTDSLAELQHDDDIGVWQTSVTHLRDRLLVCLCDDSTCDFASLIVERLAKCEVLGQFVIQTLIAPSQSSGSPSDAPTAVKPPPLFGVLRLLFPDGHTQCRHAVSSLLRRVARVGRTAHEAVASLMANFAMEDPIRYSESGDELSLKMETADECE